jgi:hypothetical protein
MKTRKPAKVELSQISLGDVPNHSLANLINTSEPSQSNSIKAKVRQNNLNRTDGHEFNMLHPIGLFDHNKRQDAQK